MLINLSNHPSENWPEAQKQAAIKEFGCIEDLAFPRIDPTVESRDVLTLARDFTDQIERRLKMSHDNSDAIHIMGEMTFTCSLVRLLQQRHIRCIAATTLRIAEENKSGQKISQFVFKQFRDYPEIP